MSEPPSPTPSSIEDDSRQACSQDTTPLTLGWKEYVALPDLGIPRLKAKVDTGARTSALHVRSFEVIESLPDGSAVLEFQVAVDRRGKREVTARARRIREVQVRDSGGHAELRPVIETTLALGGVRKPILLTLTSREGMLFRMLLGRKALEGDFLVDVSRKYLLGGRRRRPSPSPAPELGP